MLSHSTIRTLFQLPLNTHLKQLILEYLPWKLWYLIYFNERIRHISLHRTKEAAEAYFVKNFRTMVKVETDSLYRSYERQLLQKDLRPQQLQQALRHFQVTIQDIELRDLPMSLMNYQPIAFPPHYTHGVGYDSMSYM